MNAKPVKIPGPDHPITIEPGKERVIVKVAGRVVADSAAALILREASYPPVAYIPKQDVDFALLQPTDHSTYCPYKGDCSYFSIPIGGTQSANAVWSYKAPYEAVAQIKDYVAFYPDRVESIERQPV